MAFLRCRKMRFLYLLALLQLVGGPLVLLHVTVFCKMTVANTPEMGVARAAASAWLSDDFQKGIVADVLHERNARKDGREGDPKPGLENAKQPVLPWKAPSVSLAALYTRLSAPAYGVTWTPLWPNAPPGPPPRLV